MRLKNLKINGFKSFAKPTTLEFFSNITAVVGPNGSGKSNVAESIAWVLGEQSIKTLRGKKGEDLIFNGSKTAPKMGKASVTLVFHKDDKEEVSISRTVFRDGVNEYFINDERSRLKDVVEFLSGMGLGTSRHHIISQGEADRFLLANQEEKRAIIEDALGLRIYQIKKEEGIRKLERTEENINQVESLRREIQPHLRFLKKQVGRLEEMEIFREKLKNLYAVYFRKLILKIKKDEEKLAIAKSRPETDLGEVNKKIAELKEKISGFSGEKDLLFKARAEVNQLEREIGRIEGMLSAPVFRSEPKKAERRFFEVGFVKKFSTLVVDSINEMLSLDSLEAVRGKLTRLKDEAEKYFREDGEVNAVAEEERAKEREKEMEEIKKRRDEISASLEKARGEESRLLKQNEEMISVERELYGRELELSEINGRMRSFAIEEERLKMQKDDFERERAEALAIIKDDSFLSQNFDVLSDEDLDFSSLDGQRRDIERLKIKIEESGGVSEEMVKEFNEIKSRDEFLEKELGDLGKTAESLRDLVKQLEERLTSDFKEGVEKINKEFNNFFGVMFGGGKAELKIISAPKKKKSEDAESAGELLETEAGSGEETAEEEEEREGVDIKVDLPRKRIHSLSMLSGGERALTSIALLFAMSQVNPPPFLILDETDAALDESNSRKYGQMLQSLSGKTQLILVTHNRETMRCAGALFGVTMGNDSISRLLSVKLTEAEGMAGKAKIAEKQEV